MLGAVDGVDNFPQTGGVEGRGLDLSAVESALLDGGVDLGPAHRGGDCTHIVDRGGADVVADGADALAGQVLRGVDDLVQAEVTGTGVPVGGDDPNTVVVSKLLYPVSILLSLHNLVKTGVVIHEVGHAKDAEIGNILRKTAGVGNSQNSCALKSLLKDIVGLAEGRAEEALRGEVAVGSLCELVADSQQGLGLQVSLGLSVAELDGSLLGFGGGSYCGTVSSGSSSCGGLGLSTASDNGHRHDKYEHECDNFFHRFSSINFLSFTSVMLAACTC